MATILKITDIARGTYMEASPFGDNQTLEIAMDDGDNSICVSLNESEVKELITYLDKRLKEMF